MGMYPLIEDKMNTAMMDTEANHFAVHLLMPDELLLPHLAKGFDLADDQWMERTARKFRVPIAALAFRLIHLEKEATGI